MNSKRIINLIGALMFVAMGIYIVVIFFQVGEHDKEIKTWTPTKAVVSEVFRVEGTQRVGPGKIPQLETGIRYAYTIGNQEYRGEKKLSDGDARLYQQGQQINVLVNPKNPLESDYDYVNEQSH